MPLQRFSITRNGEPLHAVPIKHAVRTGIEYNDPRIDLGLIPEFEEREAAAFVGIPWPKWLKEKVRERAAMVAHYRMHYQISLHSADAAQRYTEQQAKRHKAAG